MASGVVASRPATSRLTASSRRWPNMPSRTPSPARPLATMSDHIARTNGLAPVRLATATAKAVRLAVRILARHCQKTKLENRSEWVPERCELENENEWLPES